LAFHMKALSYSSGLGWYLDNVVINPFVYPPYPPYLLISLSGTNTLTTWPAMPNYVGLNLFSTTNVSGTNWNKVSSATAVINGLITVTNPTSRSQEFYRLSR